MGIFKRTYKPYKIDVFVANWTHSKQYVDNFKHALHYFLNNLDLIKKDKDRDIEVYIVDNSLTAGEWIVQVDINNLYISSNILQFAITGFRCGWLYSNIQNKYK